MSLTRRLIQNRHAVWALAIGTAIFGTVSYLTLPIELFPETSPPVVNVITPWPGASASDVAEGLLPLEEEVAALEGIVRVRSSAQDNLSLLSLEFSYDREVELAAVDVQNAVARVRGRLPRDIGEPQVLRFSTSDRPVITVGAAGEDLVAVRRLAQDVFAPRLQQTSGVAAVDVFGGAAPAVVVEVDRRALEAHRIPLTRIVEVVVAQNAARPAGRLRTETRETLFRVETRAADVEALERIPVATQDGSRLLLGDLARVRPGALTDDARFAIDGRRAVALQVFAAAQANTVEVVRAVEAAVEELGAAYPDVTFSIGEESATFTETVVGNLLENVWQALLLASVIIFLFLASVRGSLVAVLSMPLAYALTFAGMKVFGIELNMVTLTAVILAVGMVVDASVVVLENITRRHDEDGLGAEEAAIAGVDEVRMAVLAGAGTTLVVLLPLLFLDGFTGKTFGPLATTLILAFTSSVVVALTFVPVLTLYTTGRSRADRVAARLTWPFTWSMGQLRRAYLWLLGVALRRRLVTVVLALLAFLGGAAGLRALGMDVLPKMDGGSFYVSLETPSGTSLEETERVVREVEAAIGTHPEVVKIQSQVGFEQGMRSFAASGVQGATQGFITVTLSPRTERKTTLWELEDEVRDQLSRIPGIRAAVVRDLGNTAKSTTAAPIMLRLDGPDPLVLDRLGEEVLARVRRVPGLVDASRSWRLDQQRTRVEVDALRAGRLGLAPSDVAGLMMAGSEGVPAGTFHDEAGSPLPVRVRYDAQAALAPEDLLDYPVMGPGGTAPVPLRAIARLEETTGQGLVTGEDLASTLEISAFTRARPLNFAVADVEKALEDLVVPRGYELTLTGERRDLAESRGELGSAFAIAVVLVYLLLVAQFRSFLHPLTVLVAVPLSLAGVALALALAGKTVSMPVMVGLVLLVGTVVNNSIILIDFVERAREGGADRRKALRDGVSTRFRPIMMTSLSTMVGMLPLAAEWALGAERFSPLATAVIGGLGSATLLTLIVIPVFYDLADDLTQRLRLARPRPAVAAAAMLLALVLPFGASASEPLRLDLEESLALAREQSDALADHSDLEAAARLRRKEAGARSLPRLDVTARYSRLSPVDPATVEVPSPSPNLPAPDPVVLGETIENQVGLRATLTQPLFTGFALTNGRQAAGAAVALAESRTAVAEADLVLEVTERYFRLLQARELVGVAEASVRTVETFLARAERLAAEERVAPLEVARLNARLAEARLARERALGSREVAGLAFADLLGLDADAEVVLTESLAPPPPAQGAAPELALAQSAARLEQERAQGARASLWPQLSLVLGANYDRPNQRYFPPENEFDGSWDASVVLQWTVFDFGARRHAARAAALDARRAARDVERVERGLRQARARGEAEVRTARARIGAARASIAASEEAARIAGLLFESQRLDASELVERDAELARARAELVAALADARIAEARLERVGASNPVADARPPGR